MRCFDDLVRKWLPSSGGGGGWGRVSFSPSGSNSKNKNKSPMLIPISFHEVVIINKCICHRFYFYIVYNLVS